MQPLRYTLATGQEARNFRKRLASRCDRPGKSVLTTKFRLECPPNMLEQLSLERVGKLYDTLEGTAPGSLSYLVFVLQAAGFRIFPKFADTRAFASKHTYHNKEFVLVMGQYLGKEWKSFTPVAIVNRLQTEVRARSGKDNRFVKTVIASEYGKTFKAQGDGKKEAIINAIAETLAANFESWQDLKKRTDEACLAIDEALAAFSDALPKIGPMFKAASEAATLPQNSTIAFDPDAEPHACPPSLLPYRAVATALGHSAEPSAEEAQNGLTTKGNHEGLSWLLGSGLTFLRNSSVEDIQTAYGIPASKKLAATLLKEAVDAIPEQTMLAIGSETTYSKFRQNLGGHLDSWIANYVSRLLELYEMLQNLPEQIELPQELGKPEYEDLFAGISRSVPEVRNAIEALNGDRAHAWEAIRKLLGFGEYPEEQDVADVIRFSNRINALVSLREELANAITNRERDGKGQNACTEARAALEAWKDLKRFPKLNRLSGGVPDIFAEMEADAEDFKAIQGDYAAHFQRVQKWLADVPSLMATQLEREEEKLRQRPGNGLRPLEQAVRFVLHRIGHTARMHPGPVCERIRQWFLDENIFIEKKAGRHTSLNSYFINRKWPLYTSPFSSRNNFAYAIRPVASLEEAEGLWTRLQSLIDGMAAASSLIQGDFDGLQALMRARVALELTRVQRDVPASVAQIMLPSRFDEAVPDQFHAELRKGLVCANTFRRAFNAYASILSGLNIHLRREIFFLRTKFTWVGNTELLYVPKNRFWAVPERYRSIPEWRELLESGHVVWSGKRLDVKATFEALKSEFRGRSNPRLLEFMVQLPHDWCYELPVPVSDNTGVLAVSVQKRDCKFKKVDGGKLARLVGPSSFKSRLDRRLLAYNGEDIGDMTILCDFKVRQSFANDTPKFDFDAPAISLAIPISEVLEGEDGDRPLFRRLVAIDQGEAGLAFAVFNLADFGKEAAEPVASGTVRIKSIRRLIKAGQGFRKGKQLVQKFNQRFDATMFNLRENVVGDVCSVIEGLMHRYNAFPVLESEVRNLESGSRQLTLVYKAVNNRFLLADSDMPNNERAAWWYGAKTWTLPSFTFLKNDGSTIPLRLYPGRSVPAANTSRICSVCRRNALELIKALEADHQKKVSIREGGIVAIPGQPALKLFRAIQDKKLKSEYIRQNLFAPMLEPVQAGEVTVDELKRLIRQNMRRRHASRQSRDTTQSVYYCVFEDCPSHEGEWEQDPQKYKGLPMLRERHADINAAINIGRRFLTSENIRRS